MEQLISIPLIIFLPMLISLLTMSPLFTNNSIATRRFTKTFCVLHFLYTILVFLFFDPTNPYTSQIHFFGLDWIQALGIKFSFKIDAIRMILVILTSFVFLMASIATHHWDMAATK
jgi:NADH:ubiquinone oxidoreductase subunit 4 (subunit M)